MSDLLPVLWQRMEGTFTTGTRLDFGSMTQTRNLESRPVKLRQDISAEPRCELLTHFFHQRTLRFFVYKVFSLVWVIHQIIEFMGTIRVAVDIFPLLRPNHPDGTVFVKDDNFLLCIVRFTEQPRAGNSARGAVDPLAFPKPR